jgi:hypothetical protein
MKTRTLYIILILLIVAMATVAGGSNKDSKSIEGKRVCMIVPYKKLSG